MEICRSGQGYGGQDWATEDRIGCLWSSRKVVYEGQTRVPMKVKIECLSRSEKSVYGDQ